MMFKSLNDITEKEAKKIFKSHTEGRWVDCGGIDNKYEPYEWGDFIYTFRGCDWGVRKSCLGGWVKYEKGKIQY